MHKLFKGSRYKYLIALLIGLFFAYFLYTCKSVILMGDDLRYSFRIAFNGILPMERISNLYQVIESAVYDYMIHNARICSTILVDLVLIGDYRLYRILGPIVITLMFVLPAFLFIEKKNYKRIFEYLLIALPMVGMIGSIVSDECFYWITGAVYAAWPVIGCTLYIWLLVFKNNTKISILSSLLIVLLAAYTGTSLEHISVSVSILSVLCILYYVFYKKQKDYFTGNRKLACVLLWIFNFIEFISPGTRARFTNITLTEKVIAGLNCFAQKEFSLSNVIPLIMIIVILTMLLKKNKKLFVVNAIVLVPVIIGIVLNSIPKASFYYEYEWLSRLAFPFYFYGWEGLSKPVIILATYYALVILLLIVDAFVLFFKDRFDCFVLFAMSAFPLLALIPLGGQDAERVAFPAIFFMIVFIAYIISEQVNNKLIYICIIVISIFYGSYNFDYLKDNIETAKQRMEIINTFDNTKENMMYLPKFRFSTHGNFSGPDAGWEYVYFKKYYQKQLGSAEVDIIR